jgi:polyferredoxin
MLRQLLTGGLVSLANIAVHAVVMAAVVTTGRRAGNWKRRNSQFWLAAVMVATVGILLLAHTAEVITWALAYSILDVASPEADVLYFAFVNYTTLGYGDVVPAERWRLLGPIAAMNGVLLFGWSTAVIFEVLRNAMRIRHTGDEHHNAWLPSRDGSS